jgi:hypothetical protein
LKSLTSLDQKVARQRTSCSMSLALMPLRLPLVSTIAGCTVAASFGVGWWYRPIADENTDGTGPRRTKWMSKYNLAEIADEPRPVLYELASQISIISTSLIARSFLFGLGHCRIKEDEHYQNFLNNVVGREPGRSLITVSNHRSVVDDPMILSSILPFRLAAIPKYNRNGICSQDYVFASKVFYRLY